MKKHNLVESESHHQPPVVSLVSPSFVPPVPASYDIFIRQLEEQNQLINQLRRDLQAERVLRKSNTFAPRGNII